ncbi:hypothetical protein DPEC_G00286830 [Dallia pectoralis]|uniref:Uncharacterized protein n=1 Tax=Dallia pectoralis TaxID=75939 RepID=A0ACC2FK60_DALPE|nr:hypothetical protein DPEC_G00286830 [Dallia pectoralis]
MLSRTLTVCFIVASAAVVLSAPVTDGGIDMETTGSPDTPDSTDLVESPENNSTESPESYSTESPESSSAESSESNPIDYDNDDFPESEGPIEDFGDIIDEIGGELDQLIV